MTYIGDLVLGQLVHHTWTSRSFTTSQPATLTGGTVAIYKDDNIAEHLGGIALTTDFDGRTGLNNVRLSALDGQGFYNAGEDYAATLIAGTVDGVDVTGEVIFTFSISNRNVLGLSTQEIRDAMKLDPSTGLPGPDSIDSKIDSRAAPTDVVTAGAINTASGAVSTVNLCNTTTTNTDMRGTDGAALPTDIIAGGSPPLNNSFSGVQADMRAINGQSAPVNVMESLYDTIIEPFTVVSVVSAQQFVISITGKPNDYYRDAGIQFDAGANVGVQGRRITTYNGTTGQITLNEPFTTDPVPLDTGLLMGYIATA